MGGTGPGQAKGQARWHSCWAAKMHRSIRIPKKSVLIRLNQRIHGSPTGYCSTRAALLHIATLVGGLFAPPVSLKDTVLILIFGSCRFLRGEWETVLRLSSSTWLVHASQGLDKQHSMQMHQIVSTYHVVPIPSSDCQNRFCCRKMSSRSRRNLRSNVATIHP